MKEQKIRVVIIDDEKNCIEILEYLIEKNCSGAEIISTFQLPAEALKQLPVIKPDLVFLDIEMPGMNGFKLLEKLGDFNFDVIFTTAYNEFAIKAFKVNAADYLLKPIDSTELKNAFEKVKHLRSHENESIKALLEYLQTNQNINKIGLTTDDGMVFIDLDNLLYCKADGPYTHFNLVGGKTYLSSKTLGDYEDQLSSKGFYRIHNSYLINLKHITRYVRDDGGYIVMSDQSTITVSRRRKEGFLKLFNS